MTQGHRNSDRKPKVGEYRVSRDSLAKEQQRYHAAAVAYFEERTRKLEIVTTTKTRSGQTLDWIAIESQSSSGIATPPPPIHSRGRSAHHERPTEAARFELQDDEGARGPAGTVPILRKDLSAIRVDKPLDRYLSKRRARGHRSNQSRDRMLFAPPPEEGGSHLHAESVHREFNLGAEGRISVYDPYTQTSDDFSLLQVGVINDEEGYIQSAEAGIQEMQDIYGDWIPHLFVYYTTNGYASDGNNKGGYNRDVDGWVQHDGSIYPGAAFSAVSTPGGAQFDLFIKYQFFAGNWWFMAGDRWIGYYPSSLYEGNRSVFSSLGDHSNWVGFWGEVFDSDDVAGLTSTTMGSGYFAESQWPWSAFQRNLKIQVDRSGAMADYNANGQAVENPSMYNLQTHMLSGSSWGSYQWLGGPGAR